jgi:Family of unknown function (DUF5947)
VDFRLDDTQWDRFRIPVGLAFFFRSTAAGRVVAFYPGPLGATESSLELEAWAALEEENPALGLLEQDVEALLVNRTVMAVYTAITSMSAGSGYYLVPIDECYSLCGLMRTSWRGLNGGAAAWDAIASFFVRLDDRSQPIGHDGKEP